jgi:hypothetical protein
MVTVSWRRSPQLTDMGYRSAAWRGAADPVGEAAADPPLAPVAGLPEPVSAALAPVGCPGGVPDLVALRALAECGELAEAVSGLTDAQGAPLAVAAAPGPLAREIARALVEAGFTLHRCSTWDPLQRLGGVCVVPVPAAPDLVGAGGVVVCWTAHLLALDLGRARTWDATREIMNTALAEILCALGYAIRPFGSGGACIATGSRARDEVAG